MHDVDDAIVYAKLILITFILDCDQRYCGDPLYDRNDDKTLLSKMLLKKTKARSKTSTSKSENSHSVHHPHILGCKKTSNVFKSRFIPLPIPSQCEDHNSGELSKGSIGHLQNNPSNISVQNMMRN